MATLAFAASLALPSQSIPHYGYKVVHVYPHDPTAFTQGLEYRDGVLYEGTGLKGQSTLRREDLSTGRVLQQISVAPEYFGEGITVLGPQIFELTWQSQIGFVYNRDSFEQIKKFSYTGEGWGLTNDGRQIYMSDGTSQIRCLDPATLAEIRRFSVRDGTAPVHWLNELEWIKGELFANVWQTDKIVRISPADGKVMGWIDLSGLLTDSERAAGADVLNGIAYDSTKDRIFVTGKLWPKLFEIQLTTVGAS